jgi:AcrR family transcriptional regulator
LTQRKARKEATRGRVIDAARCLFEEIGYQETPVRAIALRANVSVGGVFTTFEGKVGILAHIVSQTRGALIDQLADAIPSLPGTTEERLKAVIAMAHAAEFPRLRTITAYIGCSYSWSRTLEEEHRALHRKLSQAVLGILSDGVKAGEIAPDADLELLLEMISSVYLRNYRTAWHAGFTCEQLDERIGRQLKILLNGVRP